MEDISLINSGGIGDQLSAFQLADLLTRVYSEKVKVYCSCRNEIYDVLKFFFDTGEIAIEQIEEGLAEKLISDDNLWNDFSKDKKQVYAIWPDLLYRHKYSFDYDKYRLSPNVIRNNRILLEYYYNPRVKGQEIIYCALNTSTDAYIYPHKWELIKQLALKNPEYTVYYNCIDSWNGKSLNIFIPDNLPKNCMIVKNQSFNDSLEILVKSSFCVCLDNGISHIAYNLGIPRILLDTRMNLDGLMFCARWREDLSESIGYHYDPDKIAELVKTNIEIPQTQLLTRSVIINNLGLDWKKQLNFKY